MLCQNCGKNEVNFHYTQIINGVKKEMALCDKCAKSLGLESLDFNMPINFSSFLGDFFETAEENFLPSFTKTKVLKCDNCGMTYDEFTKTGKFGCKNCYDVFSNGLNNVLKKIHGSDTHVGRKSRLKNSKVKKYETPTDVGVNLKSQNTKPKLSKEEKLNNLNAELKQAIKEERYEDAATIRDKIKKLNDK